MNKSPFVFRLLFFSCILFLVSTGIGMLYFPGGTILDHYTKGYSFFNNFFSELGRWRTQLGGTKWVSFFAFEIALLFHAFSMFVFNIYFLKETKSIRLNQTAHFVALISGCLFPFLLAGIALTPCDLYLPYHMDFVYAGFGMLIPLSFAYTVLIRKHHLLPNKYGNLMLSIVFAIGLYILLMLYGPNPHEVPYVQQTAQKLIVYSMIFTLLYLSIGCMKYLHIPTDAELKDQGFNELNN
ncbi:MAG: hypothetical protein U0U67_04485 [Chitinophagales bacterium]